MDSFAALGCGDRLGASPAKLEGGQVSVSGTTMPDSRERDEASPQTGLSAQGGGAHVSSHHPNEVT